ncbi:hypothetical protein [Dialister invisus]|uniref:hypothetical protein n=1 Tax=Dialister invisus TaxID=218538 RepID=UPI001D09749C|nr:hypothetical protein [Dialister invisus]MCB6181290.1 hypothetical protein [Dialister invisus]
MEITQIPAARAIAKGTILIIGVTKPDRGKTPSKQWALRSQKKKRKNLKKRQTISLLIPSA